jgi:hypothetical protein
MPGSHVHENTALRLPGGVLFSGSLRRGGSKMFEKHFDFIECLDKGFESVLERELMVEYLQSRGYQWIDLKNMEKEEACALMREASKYASVHLAEIEAKARFRDDIKPIFP